MVTYIVTVFLRLDNWDSNSPAVPSFAPLGHEVNPPCFHPLADCGCCSRIPNGGYRSYISLNIK